jgi:hypothetical protein
MSSKGWVHWCMGWVQMNPHAPPWRRPTAVHGPPAIYERGRGLGFGYKWLAGLDSRVCPGKYAAVDSLGELQFRGDR